MNDYELVVILKEEGKEVLDKVKKAVTGTGGKVVKVDEWGKKDLAYPIKKQKEGVYFLLNLSISADKVGEFNKFLTTNEQVLRHLLIRT